MRKTEEWTLPRIFERVQFLRKRSKADAEEVRGLQDMALGMLSAEGYEPGQTYQDEMFKVDIIQSTKKHVDAVGLREALTEQEWEAVSSRVFDPGKLEAAIKAGEIDPRKVAPFQITAHSTPYIKVGDAQ